MSIVITDLCKSFGSTPVLQRFTWTVDRPMVLMGRSGCGKTTLLRILLGLESADSGTVTGVETPAAVFQEDRLCPQLTAAANLTLTGHGLTPQNAERELRTLGFTDAELVLPAARLSGGQKRRAAIAGVIAMQPKCIVLDEPTAMLDPSGRREVIDTATKLCREQGITVVLITHHMEECVGADRVIVLSNGAVVADGAPKQVFPQVDLLQKEGLTAPVTVRLLDALRAHGMDVPIDALTVSDCADAVAAALKK